MAEIQDGNFLKKGLLSPCSAKKGIIEFVQCKKKIIKSVSTGI